MRPGADGKCPSGYDKCTEATSVANTICYEVAKGKADCPINDIVFVRRDAADYVTYSNDAKWTKVIFDEEDIFYTKEADSLPITTTQVEYMPCMKATETSLSPGFRPYVLESN